LTRVDPGVLGVRCTTKVAEVETLLASNSYTGVRVIRAGLSPTAYEVIEVM
jgi:hypothetical protein